MNESMAKASSEERKKYASNKNYQTTTFVMNVQDNKSVQDMVDYVVKEFGRLDYAVNPAGVGGGDAKANTQATIRNGTCDIGRGVIVNVNLASANSVVSLPGKGSYTISKRDFIGITKMVDTYHVRYDCVLVQPGSRGVVRI
ncbi:hypothetical protein CHU98_g9311 [Xylaria longipes]|nr:hypothetical protein CHU98_g9311 [Xylaria longipes]